MPVAPSAVPPAAPNSCPSLTKHLFAPYDLMMRDYLQQALTLCGGKIRGPGGAAELLGLNYSTLRDKMKKHGVSYGRRLAGAVPLTKS